MICIAAVALEGYYLTRLNFKEHILAGISALAIFLFLCTHIVPLVVASAVLFALVTFWQVKKKKADRSLATVSPI
jgi:Flp pilus assembly protein TadB